MASVWIVLILIASIRSSVSGVLSSKQDLSQSEKILEKWPEVRNICPSKCDCDSLNNNLVINCGLKKMDSFPANLPSSIFKLNFAGNNILRLSYTFSLKNLNALNVSENRISEIDYQWVSSLAHLEYLDLSKNSLHSKTVERAFHKVPLLHLDLSNNQLNAVTDVMFQQMKSLLSLNLSFNKIETISYNSFCDLTELTTLDLSYNKLSDIPHEWLKNLQNLEILLLEQNNIKFLRNVVFSTLKNLQVLDLSKNSIKSIGLLSFKGLTNLKVLNISSNDISHLQDGVFRSLESTDMIDLSDNPVTSLNNIFTHAKSLEYLHLKNLGSLTELTPSSLIGAQELKYIDFSGSSLSDINLKAFSHSQNLRVLDLSNSNLTNLKMGVFNNLRKIETLKLSGNPWKCDCYMYWLLMWLGEHTNSHLLSPSETYCSTPPLLKDHALLDALDHSMTCTNAAIQYHTNKTKFKVGSPALLECKVGGSPLPSLTWITPEKEALHWDGFKNQTNGDGDLTSTLSPDPSVLYSSEKEKRGRFYLMPNGNLAIRNVERGDGGFYVCIATNPLSYDSVSIRLTLDYEYLVHIKIISVLVGLATSFGFLLLTLVSVLIQMILRRFGVKCPCRKGNASPRTQQIKKILESMEHYKKQQLDRLRGNYNVQVQKIKDNCMQQMERLRESYSSQAECLRDFKEYGTLQIDRIRENYYSQVQRVRDYSASQIIRLRENYLYQRNRIRKFSAHHLYKLRENYKVQQQHINKILENLNIESCRNVCQRTESMVFEPDINLDNVLVPKICLQRLAKEPSDSIDNSSQISAYFTPDEAGSEVSGHESDSSEIFENRPRLKASPADVVLNIEDKATSTSDISDNKCESVSSSHEVNLGNQSFSNETIV